MSTDSASTPDGGQPTDTATGGEPRRPQPVLIGLGAVAFVGLIVVGAILVRPMLDDTAAGPSTSAAIASASPAETASPAPTLDPTPDLPSSSPSATPAPTASPPPSGAAPMTWSSGTAPNGNVFDIAWIGDRWLAVGSTPYDDNRPRAATWTSVDGLTWEPGAEVGPDPVPGPDGMSFFMDHVLVLADEIIGFGWNHLGCCDGGRAALWRSTDAVTWTFVDTTGTDYGDTYHRPADAAIAPTGELVLLSWIGLGSASTVFSSTDGVTWVERPIDVDDAAFGDVAASDEILIAVGQRSFATEPTGVVSISADGHSWSAVAPPPGATALNDVAWDVVGGQFVVVGTDSGGRPTVWSTEDGTSWGTTTLADGQGSVASVSAADGLIVASGFVGEADDELIAWSSFDGVTWQVQPLDSPVGQLPIVESAGEGAVLHVSGTGPEPDYEPTADIWAGVLAR